MKKKLGLGSMSILLLLVALLLGLQWNDGTNIAGIGLLLLEKLGIERNYLVANPNVGYLIPAVLLVLAFFLGIRHQHDIGAKVGAYVSAALLMVILVVFALNIFLAAGSR